MNYSQSSECTSSVHEHSTLSGMSSPGYLHSVVLLALEDAALGRFCKTPQKGFYTPVFYTRVMALCTGLYYGICISASRTGRQTPRVPPHFCGHPSQQRAASVGGPQMSELNGHKAFLFDNRTKFLTSACPDVLNNSATEAQQVRNAMVSQVTAR